MSLTGAQRKFLRGQAHSLEPIVRIGKLGLSEAVMAQLEEAVASHELIKVKFIDHTDRKKELSAEISEGLDAEQVGAIGHVAIFYRQARDPEHRKIRLPKPGRR